MTIDHKMTGEMNIREMITDVVERRRDHVFLVDAATSREITYGEFHRQACALAGGTPPPRRAQRRPHRRHASE